MSKSGRRDNTMNIVRGSLDEITRPSSNRHRTGSRVSLPGSAGSTDRLINTPQMSLEYLPPEPSNRNDDIEIEEYLSSENESVREEDDYMTSDYIDTEQNTHASSAVNNNAYALQKWNNSSQQFKEENTEKASDDEDIPSDEERQIIKDIRDEIRNKVREEMEDELEQFKQDENTEPEEDEFAEMDPKLKEAILKMRKYDRILKKRTQREKTVKKERIMLQKRLRMELDELSKEGSKQGKEVQTNTERFLSLAPPPKHNEGLDLDEYEANDVYTPVFPTQFVETGKTHATNNPQKQNNTDTASDISPRSTNTNVDSDKGSARQGRKNQSKSEKNKDDFIKRNIELAGEAANPIAMTDDEKKRIEDLLSDLDNVPDYTSDDQGENNPYIVAVPSGDGFLPNDVEKKRLSEIDSRLQDLLPAEDFQSIASSSHNLNKEAFQSMLFTRTDMRSSVDVDTLGEHALRVTKEERELQYKLKDIEHELSQLSNAVEMEIESPVLSEDQLQNLLEQCSRTMSRATAETDSLTHSPRSTNSSRMRLYENPPKLPEAVLRSLLAEARGSQCSSTVTTHRQDEGKPNLQSISEEEMRQLLRDSRATSRTGSRSSSVRSDVNAKLQAMADNLNSQNEQDYYQNDSVHAEDNQLMNNELLNNRRLTSTGKMPTEIVHNSLVDSDSDSDYDIDIETLRAKYGDVNLRDLLESSDDEKTMSPHPPPGGSDRRSATSRSRNYSPALKTSSEWD